jgi:hypothetical protein
MDISFIFWHEINLIKFRFTDLSLSRNYIVNFIIQGFDMRLLPCNVIPEIIYDIITSICNMPSDIFITREQNYKFKKWAALITVYLWVFIWSVCIFYDWILELFWKCGIFCFFSRFLSEQFQNLEKQKNTTLSEQFQNLEKQKIPHFQNSSKI